MYITYTKHVCVITPRGDVTVLVGTIFYTKPYYGIRCIK